MRVAIIENTAVTHHGQVGVALHEAGARIDLFKPFGGQPLPNAQDGYDALVVLGASSRRATMPITLTCLTSPP